MLKMDKLYSYKYEFFLGSQIAILFGSLLFPSDIFNDYFSTIFFYVNIIAGTIIINTDRKLTIWLIILLLPYLSISHIIYESDSQLLKTLNYFKLVFLFIFHITVTFNIIKQIWRVKDVNKNVISGLVSGYISLGLVGFFICISIEAAHPGSFSGIYTWDTDPSVLTDRLMYFSYITLLTIGYGDIIPATHLAQKATILIGLFGQFYMVIITAVVLEKYIRQNKKE
jgi:hypothetical protein